jgi:hypothetical protein
MMKQTEYDEFGFAIGVRCIKCNGYIMKSDKGILFCECKKGDNI